MEYTENNGHLHFDAVYERELVLGLAPHGVLPKWIDAFVAVSAPDEIFGLCTHDLAAL